MTIRSLVGASTGIDQSRFSILSANPSVLNSDFESIATVTVGSGGASEIEFTSIPGTYQHLQIRGISRVASSGNYGNIKLTMNTSTAISAWHALEGDGSSALAEGYTIYNWLGALSTGASATTSNFAGSVIDVLDYASTSKTKTVRMFTAYDNNGNGLLYLASVLFNSTSAMSSLKLAGGDSAGTPSNFAQHSTFALYGIKAP